MKYPALALLLTFSTAIAWAKADLVRLVPGGKVTMQKDGEAQVTTPAGTLVDIELDMDGELEEASGSSAEKGDVFEPGEKMITLKAAVESLKKAHKTLQGEWTFEESEEFGWVYDIEGVEKKAAVDYIVSAESGKLLKTEVDE